MRSDYPKSAPDYTNAFLVMAYVNLLWFFFVVWAVWGLIVAGLIAASINHVLNRVRVRQLARAQMSAPPR